MSAWQAYLALSASDQANRTKLELVLPGLLTAPEPAPELRRQAIHAILTSLSTLTPSTAPPLLLSVLKSLGRSPAGSEELARAPGLTTLINYGGLKRLSTTLPPLKLSPSASGVPDAFGQEARFTEVAEVAPLPADPLAPAEAEALRTLCNVTQLHPSGRALFPGVLQAEEGAVTGLVRLINTQGGGFLAGRLLFLATSQTSPLIGELVEGVEVVAGLEQSATRAVATILADDAPALDLGAPLTLAMTLAEHLKLTYNLMLQFSRLPPSSASPPTPLSGTPSSPSGKQKRPVSPRSLAQRFKAAVTPSSSRNSSPVSSPQLASSATMLGSPSPNASGAVTTVDGAVAAVFLPLFVPLVRLACLLPAGSDPLEPSALLRGAMNALLNFPLELPLSKEGVPLWLADVPGATAAVPTLGHLTSRLVELLGAACDAWFPTDVVPPEARSQRAPAHPDDLVKLATGDVSKAEEVLGPLLLLLRKVTMISLVGEEMRELLLPADLDRTLPLEQRTDLTGHLVRLMSSLLLPNSANCAGELLYNLCGRDPTTFATQIGYGNASGFLQNRGELVPPPPIVTPSPSSSSKAETRTVNPITGAYDQAPDKDEVEMTSEEKEREAERLFVLFDRMQKTGVIDVENPVQKARKGERLGEEEEERREMERARVEEEREEEEALRELGRWKERKAKGTN